MGIFDFFAQKEKLTEAEEKWNRMWQLWAEGQAAAPYAQLMNYEAEVNNGGHSQYFFNTANCGDLKAETQVLLSVLPEPLRSNLQRCYEAFSGQEDICDDENDALFEECDDFFYVHERLLMELLEDYARTMQL